MLDLGCGEEAVLVKMVPGIGYSVGVDLVLPPEPVQPGEPRHTEYVKLDVREAETLFSEASFDCVVALDVVEHLVKPEGLKLLAAMERIAAKRVIVFTPNGFLPQPPAENNPHQEHISGWTVNEFRELGYRVVGVNGWKPLRGPYAKVRWFPAPFWRRVSNVTQGLVENRPERAFQLLCIKEA